MGFNSAFKGLNSVSTAFHYGVTSIVILP